MRAHNAAALLLSRLSISRALLYSPSPAQDGALRGGSLLESSSIASSISGATAAAWPQDAAGSGGYEGDDVVVVRVAVSSQRSSVSGVHACAGAAG